MGDGVYGRNLVLFEHVLKELLMRTYNMGILFVLGSCGFFFLSFSLLLALPGLDAFAHTETLNRKP